MNDEMEGRALSESLIGALASAEEGARRDSVVDLIDTVIEHHLRFQLVFSASTLEDDISQWRAYTDIGHGCCIELEDGFVASDKIRRVECVYDAAAKAHAIRDDPSLGRGEHLVVSGETTGDELIHYVGSIVQNMSRFKHASFAPEREVRWVISLQGASDDRAKELRYRPHRLGVTSYLEVPIDVSKVSAVILGPGVSKQCKLLLDDLLMARGFGKHVRMSSCTLR